MGNLKKGHTFLRNVVSRLSRKKKDGRSAAVRSLLSIPGDAEVSPVVDGSVCDSGQFSGSSGSSVVGSYSSDFVAFDLIQSPKKEKSSGNLHRKKNEKKVILGKKQSMFSNIKGTLQSSNELVNTFVSPGFLSALLTSIGEEGGLHVHFIAELVSCFRAVEEMLYPVRDGRAAQDLVKIRKNVVCSLESVVTMLSPFATLPSDESGSIKSCPTAAASAPSEIALARILFFYVSALLDEVRGIDEARSSRSQQIAEDAINKCRRYVCALSLYPVFRSGSATLREIFGDASAFLDSLSTAVTGISASCGVGLSLEDLHALRGLAEDPTNAADAGEIHAVIGACGTGDLAAARAAADKISDARVREEAVRCIEKVRRIRSTITSLPENVSNTSNSIFTLVTGISASCGVGLSLEDLHALRGLAEDPTNAADAGEIHAVIGACGRGDLAAARAAADKISDARVREEVTRCIERVRQLRASIRRIPADVASATGEVCKVIEQSKGFVRSLRETLGLNGFVEDLISSTSNLYAALLDVGGESSRSTASITLLLGRMQEYAACVPIQLAIAASNPNVVASCTVSGRESGPLDDGSSSRQVVESVLGAAFASLFGGVYSSPHQPVKSLSAVYSLVTVLENSASTTRTEISDAVSAACSEVLDFMYALNVLKEKHFNTAAEGVRNAVNTSAKADHVMKKVVSCFGPRVIFFFSIVLGMVLVALASIEIPCFKDFSAGGVASMIMLCAGIVLLGVAFTQTYRRAPKDSKRSRSAELCRGVFCALIPGLIFCAAAFVSLLRLVREDPLGIPNLSETLTLERVCIVAGILFSLISALVLACFDVVQCKIDSFSSLSASFKGIKAGHRPASGECAPLLDSASVSSVSEEDPASLAV
ncbi:hypothetical protein [Neorickettsia sennetsu]|nr:hypothetical protein [Neorickettsia sennetsu]